MMQQPMQRFQPVHRQAIDDRPVGQIWLAANPQSPNLFPARIAWAVFAMLAAVPIFLVSPMGQPELYHFAIIAAVSMGVFTSYLVAKAVPSRTLQFYFACVFSAFHFGLAPVFLIPDEMWQAKARFGLDWYFDSAGLQTAHTICLVFLLGYLLAAILRAEVQRPELTRSRIEHLSIYRVSVVVLIISALASFAVVFRYGALDYASFHEIVDRDGSGMELGVANAALTAAFLSAVAYQKARVHYFIFGAWAIWAFASGFRGEVTYPVVIALAMLVSSRKLKISLWQLLVGALAFLILSAIVAYTRVSLQAEFSSSTSALLSGLGELGGSLRPVYEVTKWIDFDGFQLGTTYYAPFERSFLKIFPIATRIAGTDDERLMNVLILRRAGPYGFSIAAEAYYNFGMLGTFLIGGLVSWLLKYCGETFANDRTTAVTLGLAFGLLVHVRQSFVTAFGSTVSMLVTLLIITLAARLLVGGNTRRY